MAFTSVTLTDVAKDPGGEPIPYAVVVVYPKIGFVNSATTAVANSGIASSAGAFTVAVQATDDVGTAPTDPNHQSLPPQYHVTVIDPLSGEHVFDVDCTFPHATSTPTLANCLSNEI